MSTQLRLLQKYSSSKQSNLDDLHMPEKLWSMITDLPLEAKITCKYLNSNNKPSLNNLEKKRGKRNKILTFTKCSQRIPYLNYHTNTHFKLKNKIKNVHLTCL